MNIFIDTNVLLNIYHFSGDDLIELEKLAILIRNKKITFFLPDQVKDEFYRNRDNKIADALKEFRKEKIDRQFPQLVKQYDEYKILKEAIKSFEASKQKILEKLKQDILSNQLKADKIISELFSTARQVYLKNEVFNAAIKRFDLGRPPGKKKSYGDSINWESLVNEVPQFEDLYFITEDSDYLSEVDNNNFNPYLIDEWQLLKSSRLFLYKNLTDFFQKNFPEIKLPDEYEKGLLIEKLSKSHNFATTHSILSQLANFKEFTKEQVNDLILASVSNSQIYWIASDEDVTETLHGIVESHYDMIEPDLLDRFYDIYSIDEPGPDDIP